MIKRCCQFFLFAGVLVFFAVANAAAANRPYAFTLTPQAGMMLFEGNQNLDPGLTGGLALGYNFGAHWGTEGVLTLTSTEQKDGGKAGDVKAAHVDLLYHFQPQERLVPYLSVAFGALQLESGNDKDEDFLAGYGAGLKYSISESVALRLDLKHLLDINFRDVSKTHAYYNMVSTTAGVTFLFGGEKMVPLMTDSDADGIVDAYDRCPGTPSGAMVDGTGCLVDADRDGVDDRSDRCPGTLAGVVVDATGCPLVTDTDQDGVVDTQDACPGTPVKTVVDARGCPKQVALVVAPAQKLPETTLTLYLEYQPNETEVSSVFATEMQKMANFIKVNPGRRFVIEGHTDSVGNDATNMKLSQLRADKIKVYLVKNLGVPASLLEARGFGESKPVADNSTQAGRQKNRRVVIIAVPR